MISTGIRRTKREVRMLWWWHGGAAVMLGAALLSVLAIVDGSAVAAWGALVLVAGTTVHLGWLVALRQRIGPERATAADGLSALRFMAGTCLAALAVSGAGTRSGVLGWLGLGIAIAGATICDWLDGPLARRLGPTRLGRSFDIEADSWLTLWSAVAAVTWAGMGWWVVVAPLLHYLHPLLAWRAGQLPVGGGPWWGRITGSTQMGLIFLALWPWVGPTRDSILFWLAWPIVAAQSLAMVLTLPRFSAAGSRAPSPAAAPDGDAPERRKARQ